MKPAALVDELNQLGIYPYVDNGKLKTKSASKRFAPEVINKIKTYKDELIDFLSPGVLSPGNLIPLPADPDRSADKELSFAQQRLWFIDRFEGGSSQYNMPRAMILRGPLNVGALQGALDEIIRRHEVLRTTYGAKDGEGMQQVNPPEAIEIKRIDLSETENAIDAGQQQQQLQLIVQNTFARPFDLQHDLMLRASLVLLGTEHYALLLNMHHIASDGWSMGVLTKEFVQLYQAFSQNLPSPLPPLPIQYADYAHWQRSDEQIRRIQSQLEYWQRQLADIPQTHSLPLDHTRPAGQQFSGKAHTRYLDKALLDQLQQLCRTHDVTLFMLLQSAFALLLGRWSNEQTVVMGTPIAGRTQHQLEPLIGFFVNTLVFNTRLPAELSFIALLKQARQTALAAYQNQDVPFEMLVETLQPQRSLSHSPLFQVMFALQNNDYGELKLADLSIENLPDNSIVTRFDLELFAGEINDQLVLRWNFADSLFETATIETLADSMVTLLRGIVEAPATPIYQLPIVPQQDFQRLNQWQQHNINPAAGLSVGVHQLVEQVVLAHPEATAVIAADMTLSYSELNRRANRLAHALLASGVTIGSLVGVSVERSAAMIVSVLAVFKAGAAYVAIDPNYPGQRQQFICRDSGIQQLITDNPANWQNPLLTLLSPEPLAELPDHDPQLEVSGTDLAYVIYTSGSTGQAKGVTLPHQVLTNLIGSQYQRYPLIAQALPTLQYSTLNFDMAIYEILTALCSASPLIVACEQQRLALPQLTDLLEQHQVGRLYLPTAMLLNFTGYLLDNPRHLPHLQLIQVAGEALTIYPQVRQYFDQNRHCQLLNLYGPSETHVVTDLLLSGDPQLWSQQPTIGKPIENVRAYVFDQQQNDLPVGSVGELCIAGPALARAYLNQPQMTAQKFIPHPRKAGERLYRTGDLVRFLPDGSLDYLGRVDDQVKIRGYRIELAEVEQQLLQSGVVKAAVVLAPEVAGNRQLVAYITTNGDKAKNSIIGELKQQLAQNLPEYMLPAHFVVMAEFALNANGKVDKQALPQPDLGAADTIDFQSPVTATEKALHPLWCRYLALDSDKVSCNQHFFALGGHSLLAMRLCNGISKQLNTEVAVRSLFEHDTIGTLATYIDQQKQQQQRPLTRVSRDTPLPMSFSQQRLWFINQLNSGSSQYNLPLAFRLSGELNRQALSAGVDKLVLRHEALRTTFTTLDGEGRQIINAPQSVLIDSVDMTAIAEEKQRDAVLVLFNQELRSGFDLAADLMLRVSLIQLATDQHIVLLTMHHIASDGWSMALMTSELSHYYNNYGNDNIELEPLPIHYGDYALWQKNRLNSERLASQKAWWLQNLAGIPQLHNLPTDKTRPAKPSYRGNSHMHRFDPQLSARLNQFGKTNDSTLFMLLQSIFALVLSHWSNESDIVIGSPVAGRNHHDLEKVIGFFVNTLVLRHQFKPQMSFAQLLAQTKTTTLGAFANQDIPFEMLVELLQPQRSVSQSPLFQVMFMLQNNLQSELQLDGLTATPIGGEARQIKHDLALSISEREGELVLYWSYATDLFEPQTISRMAASFTAITRCLMSSGQLMTQPIHQLALLGDSESRLLQSWNQTRRDYPLDNTLHGMITRAIAQYPDVVALKQGNQTISYRQLGDISQRIGGFLQANGIGPGHRVGLYTSRGPQFVLGLLAILKSGGCYIPIEINSTSARIHSIVADADISLILTQQLLLDNLAAAPVQTLLLDASSEAQWLSQYQDAQLPVGNSNDTAYICYTSGSTGKPKGVEVSHRGVVDYCQNARQSYYAKTHQFAGSLVITSLGFDITVPALYLPLLFGDCVELMPQDYSSPDNGSQNALTTFANRLTQSTLANQLIRMTPMHGEALLALLPEDFVASQHHGFVIGGEAFPLALADALAKVFPNSQIYNHYGPTEAVVGCAMFNITEARDQLDEQIPIGKAMANTELFVLNQAQQPVPYGVVGELYIGGECVTKGYINRAELTAGKFVTLDLPTASYQRFYRTGDLVKYDGDGNLWFIGRIDNQVKLRGFRIELGEIENQIQTVTGVEKALVRVAGEGSQKQLIAFVKADALSSRLLAQINHHLALTLPGYMKPDHYLPVDDIPLSANGKINHKALLEQVKSVNQQPQTVPPGTPEQQQLQAIWAKVLGQAAQTLGINDNFFAVGGHSLMIIQLFSQIRQQWDNVLSVNLLYRYPTIAQQADYLVGQLNTAGNKQPRENPGAADNQQVVTLRDGQNGNTDNLFIIHPVGGDISCYGLLARQLDTDMTIHAIAHQGVAGPMPAGLVTVATLAKQYLQQLKTLQPSGPYHLLGWSFGGGVALQIARLLQAKGEEVRYLGLIDTVMRQDDKSWAEFASRFDQQATPQDYLNRLMADPSLLANFDKAYQVDSLQHTLSPGFADWPAVDITMRVREIVLANLMSSTTMDHHTRVSRLHYYAATQTLQSRGDHHLTELHQISQMTLVPQPIAGDHFTIMQYPQVNLLAQYIGDDLNRQTLAIKAG